MEKITLNDIAGLATEKTAWRLLHSLSQDWQPGLLAEATPADVVVAGEGFEITPVGAPAQDLYAYQAPERDTQQATHSNECAEVWTLGLMTFYALMGTDIFEHQGGKAQSSDTLIPRIGKTHCGQQLSDLIYSCLQYDPAKRPTMSQIHSISLQALQRQSHLERRLTDATGKAYQSSLVHFWPEEMILMALLLIMSLLPSRAMAQVQPNIPAEMKTLVNQCVSLRQPANVSRVTRELQRDNQWTLMDEIAIDRQGECTIDDPVTMFGLNDIGYRIFKRHSGVVNQGGRFRDGRDPRYSFSFIEVPVKRQSSVTYDISGREGSQVFAIVPHDAGARFTAAVTRDGKSCGSAVRADGVCYLSIAEKLHPGDHFKLTIKNQSGQNMSFVIINYNSRK